MERSGNPLDSGSMVGYRSIIAISPQLAFNYVLNSGHGFVFYRNLDFHLLSIEDSGITGRSEGG
jgi:hypothetical protein